MMEAKYDLQSKENLEAKLSLLTRKLEREQKARKEAEATLEKKARELYEANQELLRINKNLEAEIESRNQAIVESELRYRTLVQTASDIIYNTDINGYFTFVNSVATQIFGYNERQIIGHHFSEFIVEDQRQSVYEYYLQVKSDETERFYHEFQVVSAKGDIRWIGQNVQRVINNKGETSFTAIARDITEQKCTQEELKRNENYHRIINYFSTSLIGLKSIDNILWDITTNCISKMDFEDCVIYLFNEDRSKLVQRAAFGIKESDYTILNPIEIDLGHGIVGTVAKSGKAEMVDDVEKDTRYIADAEFNGSEIAVPIIYENIVIGVIDSEHSQKGFFKDYHLEILTVIASLTANKLIRTESLLAQEESERKYRGIIENMELGLLEFDNMGIILKAYPRFCQMIGYDEHELKGKDPAKLFLLKEDVPVIERQHEDRSKGEAGIYEVRLKKKNSEIIWVLISGAPIYDSIGNMKGSIGIHYDLTPQKRLQKDLEVAKLTAERAQKAEKIFLANISHEIRTPLNAIIGMSHLLKDTTLNKSQSEYLDILHHSANLLHTLISDILDLSKIDSGNIDLKIQAVNINELIDSISKTFGHKSENKGVKLRAFVDTKIDTYHETDELLLNQILINLIGNAEKFTEKGEIRIIVTKENGIDNISKIKFEIEDTGIGIPAEKLELIFKEFQQADDDTNVKYGGTGLGLSITKKLINLLGSDIHVESEVGRGTKFYFTIDMTDTGKKIHQESETTVPSKTEIPVLSSKILVVEDNLLNQKYITTLFKKWNLDFDLAENGEIAVDKCLEVEYCMIFMDLQMPVMDGFEATNKIRTKGLNIKTPIIALTASTFLDKKKHALSSGMQDFLSKPFFPDQIMTIIARYAKGNKNSLSANEHIVPEEKIDQIELDPNYLKNMFDDDKEYAADILSIFLETIEPDLTELFKSIESLNYVSIKEIAHRIKPSFKMVGLNQLSIAMKDIEILTQDQKSSNLLNLKSKLEQMLPFVLELVKNELLRLKN